MTRALDRLLMRYLKRRGWVVFWLDEPARACWVGCRDEGGQRRPNATEDSCWLALYESERKAGR
jgi:hypothetical protein